MSKKKDDRPVFSEHNKELRERQITEWVNRKLDDELEKLMDGEHVRLREIDFFKWCAEKDEDQSDEALALRAAETGDIAPLRELFPRLANFLNLPKKENRGGDRRTETEKREAKERYERDRLALFEYRRITKLLKYLKVKSFGELAVKIAAARWANFDEHWANEIFRRKFGAEELNKFEAKVGADLRDRFEEGLRHKFETELEQAKRHPSKYDL